MGASVQGLLTYTPEQHGDAAQPERERDGQGHHRVQPEEGRKREPDADPEGQGGPVGRVVDLEEGLQGPAQAGGHASRAGSFRRPRPGSLKWSWDFGRSRFRASPNLSATPGGPVVNSPTGGDRQVPHDRHVPQAVERIRRDGHQHLVVLPAVEGHARSRPRRPPARAGRRRGRRAARTESSQADTPLSWHSVSRSPERPSERSMAAVTSSCSAEGAGEGEGRRGIELGPQAVQEGGRRGAGPGTGLQQRAVVPHARPVLQEAQPGGRRAERARSPPPGRRAAPPPGAAGGLPAPAA